MKVMFTGPLEGDTTHLDSLLRLARSMRVDTIVGLGGPPYRPSDRRAAAFLDCVSAKSLHYLVPIMWIDSPHDDQAAIATLLEQHEGQRNPIAIAPNVHYLPRGTVVNLDGLTLLAYGGGYPLGKSEGVQGTDWWAEGIIDLDDVDATVQAIDRPIDVVATYEMPAGREHHLCRTAEHLAQQLFVGDLLTRVNPTLSFCAHPSRSVTWVDPITATTIRTVTGPSGDGPYFAMSTDFWLQRRQSTRTDDQP